MKKTFAVVIAVILTVTCVFISFSSNGSMIFDTESTLWNEPFSVTETREHTENTTEAESVSQPIKQIIMGDVDDNGKVTATDARRCLRFSAKLIKEDKLNVKNADIDANGKITASDARMILRISAGLDPFSHNDPITKHLNNDNAKIIDVKALCQYPSYPSGCEAVSTVMCLNYFGFDVTVSEFVDKYLPRGTAPYRDGSTWYSDSPNRCFLGSPRSNNGWGVWAKGIEKGVESYFKAVKRQSTLSGNIQDTGVKVIYKKSLDSLCKTYIDRNIPVIVWVTQGMAHPYKNITARVIGSSERFTWISPNHCMLLVGYDNDNFIFNDPITGKREKYSRSRSNMAFDGNGQQAVVLLSGEL